MKYELEILEVDNLYRLLKKEVNKINETEMCNAYDRKIANQNKISYLNVMVEICNKTPKTLLNLIH